MSTPSSPDHAPRSPRSLYAIITSIGVAGLLFLLAAGYGTRFVYQVAGVLHPLTQNTYQAHLEMAAAQRTIECILGGDSTLSLDSIWSHHSRIHQLLTTIEKQSQHLQPFASPSLALSFEQALLQIKRDLDVLAYLTRHRLHNTTIPYDRQLTAQFDTSITAINTNLSHICGAIDQSMRAKLHSFYLLQALLIVCCTGALGAALLLFIRFFRSRSNLISALQKTNRGIDMANQQLMASEQQLQATNQQLDAANQQLRANEQQLRAANQQLQANQEELARSEKKFRLLFENMTVGMAVHEIICDSTGAPQDYLFLDVNHSYERQTGLRASDLIGRRVREVIPEIDTQKPNLIQIFGQVALSGVSTNLQLHFPPLGRWFDLFVYAPQKNQFAVIVTDITEQKHHLEAFATLTESLRENEQHLQSTNAQLREHEGQLLQANRRLREQGAQLQLFYNLLDRTNDAIYVLETAAGTIAKVNQRACSDLQRSFGELHQQHFDTLCCPEGIMHRLDTIRLQQHLIFEARLRRKDESMFPVEFNASIIVEESTEYLVAVVRDITERRTMQAQLHHAEKMEAIGQLAGGIAHDFNNQLTGIMGYADLLRERVGDAAELSRFADNILIATRRASELTNQLLAYARKGKYQSICVNMHRIIAETIALIEHSIDKRITLTQQLFANPPFTTGDPTQLQSMMLNLAINARDAMPEGGTISFTTDTEFLDESRCVGTEFAITAGTYLKIEVIDSGSGIDAAILPHIFEPFFTTKEQGKGTGMGLAAVYGTVKNHSGCLQVHSQAGEGTRFTIHLPLCQNIEEPSTPTFPPIPGSASAHIVVIDDEPLVLCMVSDMLSERGYRVSTFDRPLKALEYFTAQWNTVDAIITDMVMPEMTGRDLYLKMRALNPRLRAILSSGYSLQTQSQTIFEEGIKAFIQKPYRQEQLLSTVAEVLSQPPLT